MNILNINERTHLKGKGPLAFLAGATGSGELDDSVMLSVEFPSEFLPSFCRFGVAGAAWEGPGSSDTGASPV